VGDCELVGEMVGQWGIDPLACRDEWDARPAFIETVPVRFDNGKQLIGANFLGWVLNILVEDT
jgi:hypothetical protein